MKEMLTTWSNRTRSRFREFSIKLIDGLILRLGSWRLRLTVPEDDPNMRWERDGADRYYRTNNR